MGLPKDLQAPEFRQMTLDTIAESIKWGWNFVVFIAKTSAGMIPIGIVRLATEEWRIEPEFSWFPEASLRNRLECVAKWLVSCKGRHLVLVYASPRDTTFWTHLAKYGLLRRVGTMRHYERDGENAAVFQSVEA